MKHIAGVVKLVYTQDLKSCGCKISRVGSTPTLGTHIWSGIADLNRGPLGPKPSVLPTELIPEHTLLCQKN